MSKDTNPLLTHLLPEGTRIRALVEQCDTDDDDTVRTAPVGAYGTVDRVLTHQIDCYSVVFDCDVWVFLSQDEMAQQAEVVLRGVPEHERTTGHYWAVLANLPDMTPFVAYWNGCTWGLVATEIPWAYRDVLVLSERLSPPTTHNSDNGRS